MYRNDLISGLSLPPKTVCITFDDGPGETASAGPGPRTLPLAKYLAKENVPAAFFMVGKYACEYPEILPQIRKLGHLIGNHTYDHINLVDNAGSEADLICQLARTDAVIRRWIDSPIVFLRPPYGAWNSGIAAILNSNLNVSLNHIGPIGWDLDGSDFTHWKNNWSPGDCVVAYMRSIEEHQRGIVLLHDSTADLDIVKHRNRTFDLIKLLIPGLKKRGYSFCRLDSIPDIIDPDSNHIALRGMNGLYLSYDGNSRIIANAVSISSRERFIVEDADSGKISLRTIEGGYISARNGSSMLVSAADPDEDAMFDLICLGANQVAFRTSAGNFLMCDNSESGCISANKTWIGKPNIFRFEYATPPCP